MLLLRAIGQGSVERCCGEAVAAKLQIEPGAGKIVKVPAAIRAVDQKGAQLVPSMPLAVGGEGGAVTQRTAPWGTFR